jgi:hypothetical protein
MPFDSFLPPPHFVVLHIQQACSEMSHFHMTGDLAFINVEIVASIQL